MKYYFIFLFFTSFLYSHVIKFSPLPMDKSAKTFLQYKELLEYLEKETGYTYEFVYSFSYKELIDNFKKGKIDIVELGPLPFVKLKKDFEDAEPILTFKAKDGNAFYTCDLITTNKNILEFSDIKKQAKDIILTRKLSTCGYLMTEFIFNTYEESLKNIEYTYVGTHSKVLLELLLTPNSVGTVKSTILNKYQHFNFTKIAQSPPIPGFAFIANEKTVSNKKIQKIQNALLKLDPLHNKQDKELVINWSTNTKYGAVKTKADTYKFVIDAANSIQIDNEIK